MANKPKSTARVLVALNFPTAIANFIVYAKTIYQSMFGNKRFEGSSARITVLNTTIIELDKAITDYNSTPPKCTTAERNAALEKVKAEIRLLRNDVQSLADLYPADAEIIIKSAGMDIKERTLPGKRTNIAMDGSEEGTVILISDTPGLHEWRMSTDEKAWTVLSPSRTSKTVVPGLTPDTVYHFQNRQILTNGVKGEWSPIVKIRVK